MRILVADDHDVVRKGVCAFLSLNSKLEICGEAIDGVDVVDKAKLLRPHVIVMDISMPRMNGLEAARIIRDLLPETEILILSQHDSWEMMRSAAKAGARGYVVKSSVAHDLLTAIEKVFEHEPFPASFPSALDVSKGPSFPNAAENPETSLELITDAMAAAVTHCGRDFRYRWANKAYAEWIGMAVTDLVNRPIADVLGAEAFQKLLPSFNRVLAGETVSYEQELSVKGLGKRWVSATYKPTFSAAGEVDGWVAVVVDLTDRKQQEGSSLLSEPPPRNFVTKPDSSSSSFKLAVLPNSGLASLPRAAISRAYALSAQEAR